MGGGRVPTTFITHTGVSKRETQGGGPIIVLRSSYPGRVQVRRLVDSLIRRLHARGVVTFASWALEGHMSRRSSFMRRAQQK